jgi:hypothetical protein
MADAMTTSRPALRRAREAAFALCTLWLVLQNLVLLALLPWSRLPELVTKYAAVLKTAALVLGPVWILGSLVVLGWALMTSLARGPRGADGGGGWEKNHGRAR